MSDDRTETIAFGARLKQALGDRSIKSLARDVRVSDTIIKRYLLGKAEPSREILVRLANALHVGVAWLATGNEGDAVERPIPIEDAPLLAIKTWLDSWWSAADAKERAWLEVELRHAFSDFAEWQKKQQPRSKKQSGA